MAGFSAAPYARALFDTAAGADTAERWVEPLESMAAALESVPELQRVMVTPLVAPETKEAILNEVLEHLGIDGTVARFVHVVQGHYRLEHLSDIAAAFRALVDRALGRVHARVETAAPLDETGRRALLGALGNAVGADVVADFAERPELLAGFRVQVGSKVYDGSLDGQLERLGREKQ